MIAAMPCAHVPYLRAFLLAVTLTLQVATLTLDRFAGRWHLAGQSVGSSGRPARSIVLEEDCRWTAGSAFLACVQSNGVAPGDVTLLWWDAAAKRYRFSGVGRDGSLAPGEIDVAGGLWIWRGGHGKSLFRTTNRWRSRDLVEYRSEYSVDGGKMWKVSGWGSERRATACCRASPHARS